MHQTADALTSNYKQLISSSSKKVLICVSVAILLIALYAESAAYAWTNACDISLTRCARCS